MAEWEDVVLVSLGWFYIYLSFKNISLSLSPLNLNDETDIFLVLCLIICIMIGYIHLSFVEIYPIPHPKWYDISFPDTDLQDMFF